MTESAEEHVAGSPGADGLRHLLGLARRRAGLIAGSAASCTALAALYVLLLQSPVYRATAEVLVAPQALQVVGRDIVPTDGSTSLDTATVDSQALVMLSTAVLRRVADELDLASDPAFQSRPGMVSRLFGPEPVPSPSQREAGLLEQLKASLTVRRAEGALVFQITASNPRASQAAAIANAVARAYLRVTVQERVDAVKKADGSIVAQLSGLRGQLDEADAAVERFRSANHLVKSSSDELVVTQQLKDLYTQIDAAEAEVSRSAAFRDQVARSGPEAALADAVPESLTSPALIALRSQYAALARAEASQARTLLPQHPQMIELRAELAEAQQQLRSELARVRVSAANSYAQAVSNLSKLEAKAQELTRSKNDSSEAETKLRQLESEAQAIRAVFDASLGRARELEQQGKIETGSSRVLSEATPPAQPSRPPLAVVLAAAALFGVCLGLGSGYVLDLWSRRVRGSGLTIHEAARLLGVASPVPLPSAPTVRGGLAHSPALEAALGQAASQLHAALRHRLPAVVAVVAVEGASGLQALAEPLAQALAELGQDVLLCDGGEPGNGLGARNIGPRGGAATARAQSGPRGEFVLVPVDIGLAGAPGREAARSADAVVLVSDVGRISPAGLLAAARSIDPSRRRIVVLLDAGADAERPSEPVQPVGAAA